MGRSANRSRNQAADGARVIVDASCGRLLIALPQPMKDLAQPALHKRYRRADVKKHRDSIV